MGLPTDIIRYFQIFNGKHSETNALMPRSLMEFLNDHPEAPRDSIQLSIVVNRLIREGLLTQVGATSSILVTNYYWSETVSLDENAVNYGVFDFVINGFPFIRQHFQGSVLPLVVMDSNDEHGIGTSFLIDGMRLFTAAHCVKDMKSVQIPGWDPQRHPLSRIVVPTDPNLDIAFLEFEADPFPQVPRFQFDTATILDDVLTMGYPPIPGFDSVQVSETASVAGNLKSTTGQIITSASSYLDKQDYLLISARIKGGNSGGPVVNKRGGVVGIISQEPSEFGQVDTLGFGVAVPSSIVTQWLNWRQPEATTIYSLPFEIIEGGMRTAI